MSENHRLATSVTRLPNQRGGSSAYIDGELFPWYTDVRGLIVEESNGPTRTVWVPVVVPIEGAEGPTTVPPAE